MRQFNQEELVEKIRSERRHMDELYAQINELKQENSNLKDYVKSLKDECISCPENKKNVKQAQVAVLNKVKTYSHRYKVLKEGKDGKWHSYVFVDDINKLIKEVENYEE